MLKCGMTFATLKNALETSFKQVAKSQRETLSINVVYRKFKISNFSFFPFF